MFGRKSQNMAPGRVAVIVTVALDNVRTRLAIDLQIGSNIPAEVSRSDHDQTATGFS
jgi:hypothetical protein